MRAEHDKILAQRASLLKSARAARSSTSSMLSTLEVWDAQLAAAAARLIAARVDVVRRLRPWVASAYETVSGTSGQRSRAQIAYRSSLLTHEGHPEPDPHDESAWLAGEETLLDETTVATRLENAMGELHAREIDRGANLVGAHRDDLSLFLAGLPARGFASHGEQWSLALALRLASYDMLRTDVNAYGGDGEPVLILDDVFASLDEQRRRALAQMVAGAQQVLLTAAVDDDVPAELAGARYRVADGEVTVVEPSAPTGDGPLPDVLAQRALTRQRAQAWEKGDSRVPVRRLREPAGGTGGKDAQQAAPWDQRRELARALGQNPDDPADRARTGAGTRPARPHPLRPPHRAARAAPHGRRQRLGGKARGGRRRRPVAGHRGRSGRRALHHRVLRRRSHHPARLVLELGPAAAAPPAHHRGQDRRGPALGARRPPGRRYQHR